MRWIGYKVHLTETREPDAPNLITQVETTVGSVSDGDILEALHQDLADHVRLPSEHIVDAGYVTSDTLADGQRQHGMELLGPVRPDPNWHAAEGAGFGLEHFTIDWDNQVVICRQGKRSQK